jgi:hypothetical protein
MGRVLARLPDRLHGSLGRLHAEWGARLLDVTPQHLDDLDRLRDVAQRERPV